jgi:hypothetical protein
VTVPFRLLLVGALAATLGVLALRSMGASADSPVLTPRAVLVQMARAESPGALPPPVLPSPDASYCQSSGSGTSPPSAILGLLTVGGVAAPVNTVVQITFDGKAGLASAVRETGGYRVFYEAGGATCANKVGAAMAIVVNGLSFDTHVKVGDPEAAVFFRFDIAAP